MPMTHNAIGTHVVDCAISLCEQEVTSHGGAENTEREDVDDTQ